MCEQSTIQPPPKLPMCGLRTEQNCVHRLLLSVKIAMESQDIDGTPTLILCLCAYDKKSMQLDFRDRFTVRAAPGLNVCLF